MSNVLSDDKRQQILALGRLGWSLRRIEQDTGVWRETAGPYLKAAGIYVRPRGGWGRRAAAKPANEVTTLEQTPPFGSVWMIPESDLVGFQPPLRGNPNLVTKKKASSKKR